MRHVKPEWARLISPLTREISSVVCSRAYRSGVGSSDLYNFWETYLVALRKLNAKLRAMAHWHYSTNASKYRPARHLYDLQYEPALEWEGADRECNWAEFVPPRVKQAFREAQAALHSNPALAHYKQTKQVFTAPKPPKPNALPHGTLARERKAQAVARMTRMVESQRANNSLMFATNPEWAARREWQLTTALERLYRLERGVKVPQKWFGLLLPSEAMMNIPHDDAPRQVLVDESVFHPNAQPRAPRPSTDADDTGVNGFSNTVEPDMPKRRGRPPGVKESKPRIRRKMTSMELHAFRARKEKKLFIDMKQAQRRLGIDPYATSTTTSTTTNDKETQYECKE